MQAADPARLVDFFRAGIAMSTIAVLTTTDNLDEAKAIAAALVERKLAACVQISKIESIYQWQGATENSEEFRLLIKTTGDRYGDVEAVILELHSYDLPAVFALAVPDAYGPYAEWVAENSAGQ